MSYAGYRAALAVRFLLLRAAIGILVVCSGVAPVHEKIL